TVCRACAPITFQVLGFALRGIPRRLTRIEADGEDVEIPPDIELHPFHSTSEPGQHFAAEHWALVINRVQDQRLRTEVVAQLYRVATLIAKGELGRDLLIKMLLDADILQAGRAHIGRWIHNSPAHALSECEPSHNQEKAGQIPYERISRTTHCFSFLYRWCGTLLTGRRRSRLAGSVLSPGFFAACGDCAATGNPRCATNCMARSMGICTTPVLGSTPYVLSVSSSLRRNA